MRVITLFALILGTAVMPDWATASVVISLSGHAQAVVGAETSAGKQTDLDVDDFSGAPVTLTASASARVSGTYASASIARQSRAEWTSPDEFTVDTGFATSLYKQDGISTFIRFNSDDGGAYYRFIPTVDAILTASVATTSFGTREDSFFNDFLFGADGEAGIFQRGIDFTFTQPLTAGKTYEIYALTEVRGDSVFEVPGVDHTLLGNSHFTFSITAAQSQPGDSTVPEPATWAMWTVGFGLIGAIKRKPKGEVILARHSL